MLNTTDILPQINDNIRSFRPLTNDMTRLAGYRRPIICIVMSQNGGVWLANTKRSDV